MKRLVLPLVVSVLVASGAMAQKSSDETKFSGPNKDVTYRLLWLIESDDENRRSYQGPAREGLSSAGYGRLVVAGSATAMVAVGQRSSVMGTSRYGQMTTTLSLLNTSDRNQFEIKINMLTKDRSPTSLETTARVPKGRWFLVGSADSRAGQAIDADDGKRAVAIMRIDEGVLLLDEPQEAAETQGD
ncbi:hypothetical protein [Allorhodopirellula solitaria]|uniref:Uncharacterized protein n=1 Tax=Allorhodopirellula solitaria TaxID=2527987 RepID=A0A5C5YDY8_9BACT|nr:hypothetical protein [Allorhodopirellula solitaria]TWT73956.1 hypothetical protein CA85_08380 [Allorhodopirellula solitaria]